MRVIFCRSLSTPEQKVAMSCYSFFYPDLIYGIKFWGHFKPKAKTSSKQVLTERSMFAWMIVVARSCSIDLKDVLSYILSTVPACLSSTDLTSLNKTSKATLLHTLEKEEALVSAQDIHQISQSAVMVDAMAALQAIRATQLPNTFGIFTGWTL